MHAVVAEDADRVAVDRCPAADQRGAVARLELLEARAVDDAGDHVADVDGLAQVRAHQAEQLLGVVDRRVGAQRGGGSGLAPVQVGDDLAAQAQGVELVLGQVLAESRDLGVHLGAAERLVVALLAGGHLHERRARPGRSSTAP